MLQVGLVVVSIALGVLGIKGFTPSGLALSKNTTLTGPKAKLVGTFCILGGLALVPLFMLIFWAFSN